MKISDYVIDWLVKKGLTDIFYVPGGGISHLMDSCIDRAVNPILMRHEQACTFACEAYSKIKGMAVAIVTSGVGSVNALQGVASAYSDNTPIMVISGDMPKIDIVRMYQPVTCYATTVLKPSDIVNKLEIAYKMAKENKEPVLINIPYIVQKSQINDNNYYTRALPTRKPYPIVDLKEQKHGKYVNPYLFMKDLKDNLDKDTILVVGNGMDSICAFSVGLDPVHNWNYGAMGFDLPAAIGAYFATKKKVILVTGDGSILVNIQEIETIHRLNLPIKVYVFDNEGYGAIRRSEMRDFGRTSSRDPIAVSFDDEIITRVMIDPNQQKL